VTGPEHFDHIVAHLDFPMIVVTTVSRDGEPAGCLVGFHSQCSIDPAQYAVWLSKVNHTYRIVQQAEFVALHFLAAADRDVAALFGSMTSDDVDKFARCTWTRGHDGIPLLERVPNRFVGRILHRFDEGGDHACFVVVPTGDGDHTDGLHQLGYQQVRGLDAGHPA
jgi:flavin reductase (DIM6/NTAB) family NADH-FMN oxidoreductase RutF